MANIEIIKGTIRSLLADIDELEGIIGHLMMEPSRNQSEIRRYRAELNDSYTALRCSEQWLNEALA